MKLYRNSRNINSLKIFILYQAVIQVFSDISLDVLSIPASFSVMQFLTVQNGLLLVLMFNCLSLCHVVI